MEQFREYALAVQPLPSQPADKEVDIVSSTDKMKHLKRKVLKARRLIRKETGAVTEVLKESIKPLSPNAYITSQNDILASTVAFRAIQKSRCNKKLSYSKVRLSEYSFLENERLCGVGHEDLLEEVQAKYDLTSETNTKVFIDNVHQKRKLPKSTHIVTKKRRTSEDARNKAANNAKSHCSPFKTPDPVKSSFKPKVMPNFSRIFQAQSENTENIVEYKERKADRAAKLLSGAKPPRTVATTIQIKTPKMKKELTFTTEGSPNIANLPRFKKELVCTPYPRNPKRTDDKKPHENKSSRSNDIAENKCTLIGSTITNRLRSAAKFQSIVSSTPISVATVPINLFRNVQIKQRLGNVQQGDANRFGFKRDYKTKHVQTRNVLKDMPNVQTVSQGKLSEKRPAQVIPRTIKVGEIKPPAKTVNSVIEAKRVNDKLHRAKKDEIVRAIQTKTRVQDRDVTARRHDIKGVRTNRRFDLLMQMRCKDSSVL